MRNYTFLLLTLMACVAKGQQKTDKWLEQLLRSNASPLLTHVLDQPDTFQYQLIYTQINRDKNNQPGFKNFYLNVDKDKYFNPASTVKLPVALCALEKLHQLNINGLDVNTTMITDSSHSGQVRWYKDSLAANGLPSIAQYIKEIFLISDNDAYNRLYEFVGQQALNDSLWKKGFTNTRITRRFMPMTEEENRYTNAIRFVKGDSLIYKQAPAYSNIAFDFSKKHLVGNAYLNRNDSLINKPMDFTTHNMFALGDLQRMLQTALFPQSVPAKQRFALTDADYRLLHQYMSELPYESSYPHYDTTEYFASYAKFFMYKADKATPPSYIRIFNKPGWTYGFLIDAAYIIDFKNNIEFMVSACIYTNSDGVLNDDKYDYETIGYPFFKETGNILYQYELNRKRKHQPDLSAFKFDYH
ncbi:MAG: serine hydrolase [Chitinophagaceae bacterium]